MGKAVPDDYLVRPPEISDWNSKDMNQPGEWKQSNNDKCIEHVELHNPRKRGYGREIRTETSNGPEPWDCRIEVPEGTPAVKNGDGETGCDLGCEKNDQYPIHDGCNSLHP